MITITDLAKQKISELSEEMGIGHKQIRAKILASGCAGFSHDLTFEDVINENDEVIQFDDIKIIIDQMTIHYLENATIDWVEETFGGGFKVTSLDITGSCGCGKSVSY